jgi:hypothetical protein
MYEYTSTKRTSDGHLIVRNHADARLAINAGAETVQFHCKCGKVVTVRTSRAYRALLDDRCVCSKEIDTPQPKQPVVLRRESNEAIRKRIHNLIMATSRFNL